MEKTRIDPTTGVGRAERQEHRIEPLTNYFVGRLQQDILDGNSAVGLLMTAVNRDDAESAYTGGVDWNLRLHNAYQLKGQVAGSHAGKFDDRQSGYAVDTGFSKENGWVRGEAAFRAFSPEFNANDLGFINRVNRLSSRVWVQLRNDKPWSIFRRNSLNVNNFAGWNYDGVNLQNRLNIRTGHQLKNYWSLGVNATRSFKTMDDLETRGGPLIARPAGMGFGFDIQSDFRKMFSGWLQYDREADDGGNNRWSIDSAVTVRPASNLDIRVGPGYTRKFNTAQWVTNVDDDRDGTADHFVFGELTNKVIDLTTRLNVSFTHNLSLQFYLQPFVAVGNYKNFKELARPASYQFAPYSGEVSSPDFYRRSLKSNLVLRWEYQPGSTFFFVWSQSRSASFEDPSFQLLDGVRDSFSDDGSNIFLLKLNYWLGI
ncbi:hypothetical protein HYR99_09685 [Candidatus Poribacteria bacterium]|nr:hypothetical protein [Candidatus Poribacteria bacterium]